MNNLKDKDLGLTEFQDVWRQMQVATDQKSGQEKDEIWFTEHHPVYTLGYAATDEKHDPSLIKKSDLLETRGIEVGHIFHFGTKYSNAMGAKVPFELNKADLGNKVTKVLDIVVGIMNKYPTTSFVIEGHTDTSGPKVFNQKLSENRAGSVKDYLVNAGIASERLSAVGYGEDKPSSSNKTRKGRIANRRVEFKVVE